MKWVKLHKGSDFYSDLLIRRHKHVYIIGAKHNPE